jgi:hypothetical protein
MEQTGRHPTTTEPALLVGLDLGGTFTDAVNAGLTAVARPRHEHGHLGRPVDVPALSARASPCSRTQAVERGLQDRLYLTGVAADRRDG